MADPQQRALIAAIATVSVAGMGLSLSIPLMSLRMEEAGYSGQANGVAVAVAGVSTLLFAPLVPSLAARLGVRRFTLVCLAASILSLAALAATASDLRWWFPLRAFYSCALTGMFVASEFAVSALAPAARRGVWIGIYSTCLGAGFAAGPLILHGVGDRGAAPFAAGALLFAVGAIPVALGGAAMPSLAHRAAASPLAFILRAPSLMSAAFAFGAIETSAMGLLPVHALRNGATADTGALYVAALAGGNMLFQIPLGFLSDRVPRPALLLAVSALATAGGLVLAGAAGSVLFVPLLVVWSGVASGLYMVGLAELGARHKDADLAAANAAFIVCYASGMTVGPPLAGRALDSAPSIGLFLSLAGMAAFTLAVQIARRARLARPGAR